MFISYLSWHYASTCHHTVSKRKSLQLFFNEKLDNLLSHNSMDYLPVICFIPLTFCYIHS